MNSPANLARRLFSNPEFQTLSWDGKKAVFDQISNSPLILTSGMSRNQLTQIFNEETGGSGFQKLTRDPMYTLLVNTNPKDIASLCNVNPLVAKLCRDDNTFRNLLILHYPDSFNDEDRPYKEQYRSLTYGSRVMTFGSGGSSQLGLGDNLPKNTPIMIPNIHGIKNVSCGGSHTALLDVQGRVWTFGHGGSGQLGLGDNLAKNTPIMIPNLEGIKQVSCGYNHTAILIPV